MILRDVYEFSRGMDLTKKEAGMEPKAKKTKIIQSIAGGVIFAFAMYLAAVGGRGDMLVIFFAAFGGFLISTTLLKDFFQNIWSRK